MSPRAFDAPLEMDPPRGQRVTFARGRHVATTHRARLDDALSRVRENTTGFTTIGGVGLDESDLISLIDRIDKAVTR